MVLRRENPVRISDLRFGIDQAAVPSAAPLLQGMQLPTWSVPSLPFAPRHLERLPLSEDSPVSGEYSCRVPS